MACKKWKKSINEYIDDLMPEVQKAAFELHMANCLDCRREASELKEVVSLVKTLSQKDLPYDFESKLIRAIETDELRRTAAVRRRDYPVLLKWVGAVAAMFLILFGIFTDRLNLDILRAQPQQEQQRIMMEAAPVQEEAATDKARTDANLMTPSIAEAPKPPAFDMPVEKDPRLEARTFTADISRIETNAIDLKVEGVNVTVDTLRRIAQEYGIEALDYSCQGITFKVEEEHREILFREFSSLGRIVETGDRIGTNTISIMILYGFE